MIGAPIFYVTHKEEFIDEGLYFEVYEDGYILVLKNLKRRDFVGFGYSAAFRKPYFENIPKEWKYLTEEEVLLLRADAALKY